MVLTVKTFVTTTGCISNPYLVYAWHNPRNAILRHTKTAIACWTTLLKKWVKPHVFLLHNDCLRHVYPRKPIPGDDKTGDFLESSFAYYFIKHLKLGCIHLQCCYTEFHWCLIYPYNALVGALPQYIRKATTQWIQGDVVQLVPWLGISRPWYRA